MQIWKVTYGIRMFTTPLTLKRYDSKYKKGGTKLLKINIESDKVHMLIAIGDGEISWEKDCVLKNEVDYYGQYLSV